MVTHHSGHASSAADARACVCARILEGVRAYLCVLINNCARVRAYLCMHILSGRMTVRACTCAHSSMCELACVHTCARARIARSRTLFIAPWDRPPLGRPPRLDGPRRRVSAARARQRAGAAAARRRCRRRHCVRRCRRGSCEERRSAKPLRVPARVFYPVYATAATAALPRSARRAVRLLCRCRAPRGPSRGGVGCATAFRPAARPPHCTAGMCMSASEGLRYALHSLYPCTQPRHCRSSTSAVAHASTHARVDVPCMATYDWRAPHCADA